MGCLRGKVYGLWLNENTELQGTQFLLTGNNRNLRSLIEQNNAVYCIPINKICVSWISKIVCVLNLSCLAADN